VLVAFLVLRHGDGDGDGDDAEGAWRRATATDGRRDRRM
jgi:hypothetical protein